MPAAALFASSSLVYACGFPDVGYETTIGSGGSTANPTSASSQGGSGSGGAGSAGGAGGGGTSQASSSTGGGEQSDAGPPLDLGAAKSFAVLGGSTVTNTGATTSIVGDLGVYPGTAMTGIPVGMPVGVNHGSDAVSAKAQLDAARASNTLAMLPCDSTLQSAELAGLTLPPGVYCFAAAAAQLTGALTLDAHGDANARFVFKMTGAFTTGNFAEITLVHSASACSVFWQVGTSATLAKGCVFSGTILASASITLMYGASLKGRALAATAALGLDTASVSVASCL